MALLCGLGICGGGLVLIVCRGRGGLWLSEVWVVERGNGRGVWVVDLLCL